MTVNFAELPARIKRFVVLMDVAHIPYVIDRQDERRWMMTVEPEGLRENDALGVVFTRCRNGRMRTEIELVIDGERVDTHSLYEAISRLGQRLGSTRESAVTSASPGTRSNSVETRRATVIRV